MGGGASAWLLPTPCQLVEELLVQLLIAVLAPHGQKDVAADELVDDFAVGREAIENDTSVIIELDHHMFCLPIDVPCLKTKSS